MMEAVDWSSKALMNLGYSKQNILMKPQLYWLD